MAAVAEAQLSEVQRAFVQFCSVLQELVLNHQVAHSVIESLQADLPALQPEGPGSRVRAGGSSPAPSSGGAAMAAARDAASAAESLNRLAPRLTPAAAAASSAAAAGPSPAAECAENYIVLQNAARRSGELLGRMRRLRGRALAELGREGAEGPDGELNTSAGGWLLGGTAGGGLVLDPDADGCGGGGGGGGGRGAQTSFTVDVHVDVGAESHPEAGMEAHGAGAGGGGAPRLGGAGGGAAEWAAAGPAAGAAASGGAADSPVAGLTTPAAAAAAAAAALTPAVAPGDPGTPHRPGPSSSAAAAAAAAAGVPELAILMGELCRGAEREVELLVRIASALDLRTTPDDLYVYEMMLRLQPYTDERVVAAALAVRDALAPPPPPEQAAASPAAAAAGAGKAASGRAPRR